jgi:hypothetical protein
MTPQGLRSRVLLGTCTYLFAVVALVAGAAFFATMALAPEKASATTRRLRLARSDPDTAAGRR